MLCISGMNGDVPHTNSITCTGMTPCTEENPELEEERRVIQQQLSSMPSPKVSSYRGCQVEVIYFSSVSACQAWRFARYFRSYCNCSMFSDRSALAGSADPDQTARRGAV